MEPEKRTLSVASQHGCHRGSIEDSHGVGRRAIELAILSALTSRPRSTDDEDVAGGAGSLGLISAGNVHYLGIVSVGLMTIYLGTDCQAIACRHARNDMDDTATRRGRGEVAGTVLTYCASAPGIGRRIIDTCGSIGVPSGGHVPTVEVHGQALAEHIMACVGDEGRGDKLRTWVVRCGGRLGTIAASKGAWVVGGPNEQIARGIFESCRHRYDGEVDGKGPHTLAGTRCRWSCLGGGVDVELCGRGPWPTIAGFGQGLYSDVCSLYGLESGGLHRVIVDPGTEGYRGEGISVGTR